MCEELMLWGDKGLVQIVAVWESRVGDMNMVAEQNPKEKKGKG